MPEHKTEGSTVPISEAAIVTVDNGSDIEFWLPDAAGEAPLTFQFLTACALRFANDPQFVQEQIDWLERNVKKGDDA